MALSKQNNFKGKNHWQIKFYYRIRGKGEGYVTSMSDVGTARASEISLKVDLLVIVVASDLHSIVC